MSIATKNGSIIVKDGSIAEGCGCCGGWWCDSSANGCWCCNFGNKKYGTCASYPGLTQQFCQTTSNGKFMTGGTPCIGKDVSMSVSGFGTVECVSGPGSLGGYEGMTFAPVNGTYQLSELCGTVGGNVTVEEPNARPPMAGEFLGTVFSFQAGFGNIKLNNTACPTGYVVFHMQLLALVQWNEAFGVASFRMFGTYESEGCISIADLPPSGSWLSGRSASVTFTGVYDYNIEFLRCNLGSQVVNVSFS